MQFISSTSLLNKQKTTTKTHRLSTFILHLWLLEKNIHNNCKNSTCAIYYVPKIINK